MSGLIRKLRTAVSLPVGFVALTGVVWLMLWPARLAVMTIPLRVLVRIFGEDRGLEGKPPPATPDQLDRAETVKRAIALAARYSPKAANCYPQALVARTLLKLRSVPHAMYFGVRREDSASEMKAHAWVMVGDLPVSGGYGERVYTIVRSFVSTRD